MTKRDDYLKALGRVSTIIGVSKGLGGIPVIAADPKLAECAREAQAALSDLFEGLSEFTHQIEPAVAQPTVKALLMPAPNSKEEFALAAMAEAMGLKVTDVVVPGAKPEATFSEAKLTNGDVKEAVMKSLGITKDLDITVDKKPVDPFQPVFPVEPSDEEHAKLNRPSEDLAKRAFGPTSLQPEVKETYRDQEYREQIENRERPPKPALPKDLDPAKYFMNWDDVTSSWVVWSKKTNQPKRPYVRTGHFTAEALKGRSDAWHALTPEQQKEKRTTWMLEGRQTATPKAPKKEQPKATGPVVTKGNYRARRMS